MKVKKETTRIEGFSDGVFSIAVTLLVLDLHAPANTTFTTCDEFLRFLRSQWPTYFAFTLSFLSIFILWVNHHKIFKQIYVRNTAITFANGLILFFVSAVSYPTALLSKYYNSPLENIVVALYTGLFTLINLSYILLWYCAARNKNLLIPNITDATINKLSKNYWYGLLVYGIAFALSFIQPVISLFLCGSLLIFWALSSGKIKD